MTTCDKSTCGRHCRRTFRVPLALRETIACVSENSGWLVSGSINGICVITCGAKGFSRQSCGLRSSLRMINSFYLTAAVKYLSHKTAADGTFDRPPTKFLGTL